jgi:membrane protein YqaA with SNARE-associated domain
VEGRFAVLRATYDWTMGLAGHRHAMAALAVVAFVESSVFPVPPDILIIPMVLAAREKAWRIAAIATVASVLGGLAGYGIGAGLYEAIGRPILEMYGQADRFAEFSRKFNELGWWLVAGAGLTPFPYKVITIASGVTGLDLVSFTLASVAGRAGRFFLVAGLLWHFGPPIRRFIEAYLPQVTAVFFVLLFGGFLAARYLL